MASQLPLCNRMDIARPEFKTQKRSTDKLVWFIVYHLFDIKHYSLFTRGQEKRLHRVDKRLFQAECLGKALKGNGWRGGGSP